MDDSRWRQIEVLMEEVAELPASQRASFLHTSCKGDPALEQEVWSLLTARKKSEGFLEEPAIAVAARAMNARLGMPSWCVVQSIRNLQAWMRASAMRLKSRFSRL